MTYGAIALGVRLPTFRLVRPWPIGTRHQPSKLKRRVRFPQALWNVIGDRLAVGFLALNQATKVRPLLPEPFPGEPCLAGQTMRSHLTAG